MYLITIGSNKVTKISSECGCDPKESKLQFSSGRLVYFDGSEYHKIINLGDISIKNFDNVENGNVTVPAGGILVIDKVHEFLALKPECNTCFQIHREDPFNGRTNSMVLNVAVDISVADATLDTVSFAVSPTIVPDYATAVADWDTYTTSQGSSTKYQAWLDAITLSLNSWQTDLPAAGFTDVALPDNLVGSSDISISAAVDSNGAYSDVPIEFELTSTFIDGLKLKFYAEVSGTFPDTSSISKVDVKLEGPLEGWFFGDLAISTSQDGVNQATGSISGKLHTTRLLKTEAVGDVYVDGGKHFDSNKVYLINNSTVSKNVEYLVCT